MPNAALKTDMDALERVLEAGAPVTMLGDFDSIGNRIGDSPANLFAPVDYTSAKIGTKLSVAPDAKLGKDVVTTAVPKQADNFSVSRTNNSFSASLGLSMSPKPGG